MGGPGPRRPRGALGAHSVGGKASHINMTLDDIGRYWMILDGLGLHDKRCIDKFHDLVFWARIPRFVGGAVERLGCVFLFSLCFELVC